MAGEVTLRRSLNVWSAIGVSIALMAPAMAVNLNPQATASVSGRAVPISFALATIGALLVAYSFIRLAQRYSHSGSVYGFVGSTVGPRAGLASGLLLTVAYTAFAVVTVVASGRFIDAEIHTIWRDSPQFLAFVFALVALGVGLRLAMRSLDSGGRIILIVEGVTVILILLVCVVVFVRLLMHQGHRSDTAQTFGLDVSVFMPAPGTSTSNVFLGVVFGFLSFAGFEGAAALGEETLNPRRDVPRAVAGTVIFGGLFFVVVTAVEMMGFGTDDEGLARFIASESLVGDLARTYVSGAIGHVVTVGAAVSAVSCAAASLTAASRLVYAITRDVRPDSRLARVSIGEQVPAAAAGSVAVAVVVVTILGWIAAQGDPFPVIVQAGAAGTLVLLVAYLLATVGCMRLVFSAVHRTTAVPRWQVMVPVAGLAVLGYTIWRNLVPLPRGAAWWGVGTFLVALVLCSCAAALWPVRFVLEPAADPA